MSPPQARRCAWVSTRRGAAGQRAEIVRNGEVVATLAVAAADQELSCAVTMSPGQWVHVRLRDAQGITAFTNPVYARSN